MKTSWIHRALGLKEDRQASKAQKTIALSLAATINTFLGVVLTMIMSRVLTKADLATYQQTFLAYNTFAPILGLGIASGLYYVLARNESRQRAVIKEGTLILLVSGCLFSCFVFFGGNYFLANLFGNPRLADLLPYLIPYSIVMIPATMISTIFVSRNLISFNAKYNVFTNLLTIGAVFVSVLLFRTPAVAVISQSFMGIIISVVSFILIYLLILPHDDGVVSFSSVRTLLKISIPLGLASMAGVLDKELDKWVVSSLLSPEEFAVFAIAAREIPLVGVVTGALSTVILVEMVQAVKRHDHHSALRLFKMMAEKASFIMLPVMMFFMASAPAFIETLFTRNYLEAVPIFRVYLLYLPVRTVVYGPFLIALGRSNAILIKTLIGLLANLTLNLVFVSYFGVIGAAIATILSIYLINVPINFFLISSDTGEKWYRLLPFRHYAVCLLLSLPGALFCATVEATSLDLSALSRLCIEASGFFIVTLALFMMTFKITFKSLIQRAQNHILK